MERDIIYDGTGVPMRRVDAHIISFAQSEGILTNMDMSSMWEDLAVFDYLQPDIQADITDILDHCATKALHELNRIANGRAMFACVDGVFHVTFEGP
jgi:hypothetical protein